MMSKLFEASTINTLLLQNRFVRSATWEGMASDNGSVTPKLIETMIDLAKGGVGLIISSHIYISPEGQAAPWQLGIYKDELIEGLQRMTGAVHAMGGKIVAQLSHGGQAAMKHLTGLPPLMVSKNNHSPLNHNKEITTLDIQNIVIAFSKAANRAKSAGFDGVQIHSAHGYLLNQTLSPAFNLRHDDYGGNIHNRSRLLLEVYRAIRITVGQSYPVLVKMNSQDFIENGLSLEDSLITAALLAEAGIDAIELSGGMSTSGKLSPSRTGINKEDKEAYFQEEARAFKKQINIPLILVGGIRSFSVANRIIDEGIADYISMSRPFIREPNLINRWKNGDLRKSTCLSDNKCFSPGIEGKGVYCVIEERERSVDDPT
jgi:2,4-dienoyl-CoA reductase-like NADH-dependent reductase (Old Yellow Enzyme family)